ncbi:hypothetical protein ACIODT_26825 [Streptomyces sp. NPDC088251]|uniref:hypothetical protein n=1 Tax=unclassified Streptomyces TaxID=2593676 RepID=UPI003805BC42
MAHRVDGAVPAGQDVLFVVRPDGRLAPVTSTRTLAVRPGDVAVLLTSPSERLPA